MGSVKLVAQDIPEYDELSLRIQAGRGDAYRVLVQAPGGETVEGEFSNPFGEYELDNFVLSAGVPRRTARGFRSSSMERAKDFGSRLHNAHLQGEVRDLYLGARRSAEERHRGLRVTLCLTDAPELMEIPWEFLYERPQFLAQSMFTPVVRSLDLETIREPWQVRLPLRILGMVSSPAGFPSLDVEEEKQKVEESLGPLIEAGVVQVNWLPSATLAELDKAISAPDEEHVLHYIGHGAYDQRSQDGVLVLEDPDGRPSEVSGAEVSTLLQDERSMRLVVLNACEGARGSHVDPFSGVASSIVECGIPAVIGMQFEITDEAAIAFSERLYRALAHGYPVDAALAQARKAIFAGGNDIEFGTPVLFLRSGDARLFDPGDVPSGVPAPVASADGGAAGFSASLQADPADANPGDEVSWRVTIENTGEVVLTEVTAADSSGAILGRAARLDPGQHDVARWKATVPPDGRELVTVSACDPTGSQISEQLSHAVEAAEPPSVSLDAMMEELERASAGEPAPHESLEWGGPVAKVVHIPHEHTLRHVTIDADGALLGSASGDKPVRIFSLPDGEMVWQLDNAGSVKALAFSPDAETFAAAATGAWLWRLGDGERIPFPGTEPPRLPDDVEFSPDGRYLAFGLPDNNAVIYEVASGEVVAKFKHEGFLGNVTAVAFSSDGSLLATASAKTGRLWDVASGRQVALVRHTGVMNTVTDVAIHPDLRTFATSSLDKTARIWRASDGEMLRTLKHDHSVRAVAFSPDGGYLATACDDSQARILDLSDGSVSMIEHTAALADLDFSADGKYLATACAATAHVWTPAE